MSNQLTYFTVTGAWFDVEAASTSGSVNEPQFLPVTAFVTFTPRIPGGFAAHIADLSTELGVVDTAVPLAPITARIVAGELSTINAVDTAGVRLAANSAPLSAALHAAGINDGALIYDVSFTHVSYASQQQALSNFAFAAPSGDVSISITDPDLSRLQYQGAASLYRSVPPTGWAQSFLDAPDVAAALATLGGTIFLSAIDNNDGTATLTGTSIVDNDDGTASFIGMSIVDQDDGTGLIV